MDIKHILIVGSGSVGKRHARNLSALGCRISCVDPRQDRLQELAAEVGVVGSFRTIEAALGSSDKLNGVVICSPPHVHVGQTLTAFRARIPVLLEKPVAPDLNSARQLLDEASRSRTSLLLGYTWRWWPPLRRVRQILAGRVLGKLHHVQFHMSAHLADWHPWEPYQEFFMASKVMGGGALLDESHWIDLALWMFGMPQSLMGTVEKLSLLQIDTDDNVDVLMAYADNLRVTFHLDLYGRPHEKFIRFIGEKGTMLWTAVPNQITRSTQPAGWEQTEIFDCERNDMFVAVAEEFLAMLQTTADKAITCTLEDGIRVLEVVEAIRESSVSGRKIHFGKESHS